MEYSQHQLNQRVGTGATADKHQGDGMVCRGSLVSDGTSSNIVRHLYTLVDVAPSRMFLFQM